MKNKGVLHLGEWYCSAECARKNTKEEDLSTYTEDTEGMDSGLVLEEADINRITDEMLQI